MDIKLLEFLFLFNVKREEGYVDPLVEDFCEIIEPSLKDEEEIKYRSSQVKDHLTIKNGIKLKIDNSPILDVDSVSTKITTNLHKPVGHNQAENEKESSTFRLPTIMACALCDQFECLDRRILTLHVKTKHKDILG